MTRNMCGCSHGSDGKRDEPDQTAGFLETQQRLFCWCFAMSVQAVWRRGKHLVWFGKQRDLHKRRRGHNLSRFPVLLNL